MKKLTTLSKSLEAFVAHQIVKTEKLKAGEDIVIIEDTGNL